MPPPRRWSPSTRSVLHRAFPDRRSRPDAHLVRAVGLDQVIAIDLSKEALGLRSCASWFPGSKARTTGQRVPPGTRARQAGGPRPVTVCVFLGPTLAADAARGSLTSPSFRRCGSATSTAPSAGGRGPSASSTGTSSGRRQCGTRRSSGRSAKGWPSSAPPAWAPCARSSSRPSGCAASAASSRPTAPAASTAPTTTLRGRRRGGRRARAARERLPRRFGGDGQHPVHAGQGGRGRGRQPDASRRALVKAAKALFFPDRAYPQLLTQGRADGLHEYELAALENWLPRGRVDQKRLDAVALLQAMRAFCAAGPPPGQPDFTVRAHHLLGQCGGRLPRRRRTPAGLTAALRLNPRNANSSVRTTARMVFRERRRNACAGGSGEWIRDAGYPDPASSTATPSRSTSDRPSPPWCAVSGHSASTYHRGRAGRRRHPIPAVPTGADPVRPVAAGVVGWPRHPARCFPGPPTTACTSRTPSRRNGLTTRQPAALSRARCTRPCPRPRGPLRPSAARHPCVHGRAHVRHDPLRPRHLGALSRR